MARCKSSPPLLKAASLPFIGGRVTGAICYGVDMISGGFAVLAKLNGKLTEEKRD